MPLTRASTVLNGPTKVGKLKPGMGRAPKILVLKPKAARFSVRLWSLKPSFHIRQQGRALFQRAGLRLLQRLVRKLDAGAAFGGNGHLHGALQAQLAAAVRGHGQTGRKQDQAGSLMIFSSVFPYWTAAGAQHSGLRRP